MHNKAIVARYEKTSKVYFYGESNFEGRYIYFANKLIKDYQSGDNYQEISVCRDFEYKTYDDNKECKPISFHELADAFSSSNLKNIDKHFKVGRKQKSKIELSKIKIKYLSIEKNTFSAYLIYIDGHELVGRCIQPFWISKNDCELIKQKGGNGEKYCLIPDFIVKKETGFEIQEPGNIFLRADAANAQIVTKGGLYQTQIQALNKVIGQNGTVLYMDAGTGKTRVYIDAINTLFEQQGFTHWLFIAPKDLINQIKNEFKQYSVSSFDGSGGLIVNFVNSEKFSQKNGKYLNDAVDFLAKGKAGIIFDECHSFKNKGTNITDNMMLLRNYAEKKIIGSGSVISKSVLDLYNQLRFLGEKTIPDSQEYFCNKYIVLGKDDRVVGYRDLKGLAELVSPFVFRCNLADVTILPSLHFKEHRYEPSSNVRQDAGRIEDGIKDILDAERVDIFKLYKFYAEYKTLINNDVARIKATVELVNGLNGQIIVASRFLAPIDFVAEGLNKSFRVVNGATKQKDRMAAVADFEAGKFDVLICSEILSTGFNLQYCNQLVFTNTDFNYKNREQMIGRIQRIGQKKEMFVYDVLTFDETSMDNRIMKNLNIKKDLIKGLNNGFGEL